MGLVVVVGGSEVTNARISGQLRDFGAVALGGFDLSSESPLADARVIVLCVETVGTRESTLIRDVVEAFQMARLLVVTRVTAANVRCLLTKWPRLYGGG
jgi:hypothetical protein